MDGDVHDPVAAVQINGDAPDAVCIFCGQNVWDCRSGKEWMQCKRCELWCHERNAPVLVFSFYIVCDTCRECK